MPSDRPIDLPSAANAAVAAGALPPPLQFRPLLYPKVWGGRALEQLGKTLPAGQPIGESWELADLAQTSASGAGGGTARSIVAGGPLDGLSITEVIAKFGPEQILGPGLQRPVAGATAGGQPATQPSGQPTSQRPGQPPGPPAASFPLLIKFLDARENLSVQVHPSPAYATLHPMAKLKTECWYILHAEPGAVIYKGVRPGVTPEAFARHITDGTVAEDLLAVPAVAGECHNLPSGTVHALGAGVLVAEVQTPSDTTFRVFDWGRTGRELHIAEAMACIDFGPAPEATFVPAELDCARLVSTEFFTLDECRASTGEEFEIAPSASACEVLMVVRGGGTLRSQANLFAPIRCDLGSTTLIPFAVLEGCIFSPESETTLLRAVPR